MTAGTETGDSVPTADGRLAPVAAGLGRPFAIFWSSSTVSAFGDNLRSATLPLLAATLTRDPTILSLVTVMSFLPWLFFGALGGVVGDRYDRVRVMRSTNIARFILTAAFVACTATGFRSISLICSLTASLTILQIVYGSAATGYLTEIVRSSQLTLGNSRLESGRSLAGQFLGAPVGAALFMIAPQLPLAIDSATFVIAALLLTRVRSAVSNDPKPRAHYLLALRQGWQFLRHDATLTAVAALLAVVNFVTTAISAIMVLYVLEVLDSPSFVYGLLLAALALGAFIGTFTTKPLIDRFGGPALLIGSVAGRVLCLVAIGFSSSAWIVAAALIVQGVTMTSWNVLSTTTIQTRTPRELVGRVGTLVKTIAISSAPLGAAAAGLVARPFGLRSVFLLGAVFILVAGTITIRRIVADTTPITNGESDGV